MLNDIQFLESLLGQIGVASSGSCLCTLESFEDSTLTELQPLCPRNDKHVWDPLAAESAVRCISRYWGCIGCRPSRYHSIPILSPSGHGHGRQGGLRWVKLWKLSSRKVHRET